MTGQSLSIVLGGKHAAPLLRRGQRSHPALQRWLLKTLSHCLPMVASLSWCQAYELFAMQRLEIM